MVSKCGGVSLLLTRPSACAPRQADEDPVIEQQSLPHPGTVNRLKLMPKMSHICATWSDMGKVHVWDLSSQLATLHQPGSGGVPTQQQQPLFTFEGHKDEGYAIDFSEAQQVDSSEDEEI